MKSKGERTSKSGRDNRAWGRTRRALAGYGGDIQKGDGLRQTSEISLRPGRRLSGMGIGEGAQMEGTPAAWLKRRANQGLVSGARQQSHDSLAAAIKFAPSSTSCCRHACYRAPCPVAGWDAAGQARGVPGIQCGT